MAENSENNPGKGHDAQHRAPADAVVFPPKQAPSGCGLQSIGLCALLPAGAAPLLALLALGLAGSRMPGLAAGRAAPGFFYGLLALPPCSGVGPDDGHLQAGPGGKRVCVCGSCSLAFPPGSPLSSYRRALRSSGSGSSAASTRS